MLQVVSVLSNKTRMPFTCEYNSQRMEKTPRLKFIIDATPCVCLSTQTTPRAHDVVSESWANEAPYDDVFRGLAQLSAWARTGRHMCYDSLNSTQPQQITSTARRHPISHRPSLFLLFSSKNSPKLRYPHLSGSNMDFSDIL